MAWYLMTIGMVVESIVLLINRSADLPYWFVEMSIGL